MKLLVTGVGGFFGTALAKALAAAGEDVFACYLGAEPRLEGVELAGLRRLDILDSAAVRDAVAAAGPDAIVHLAGLSHVGESWSRETEYIEVNVDGTANVAVAALEEGVPRLLLASSAEVYGRVDAAEQPIREDREPAPVNPYARTKEAAEKLVLARNGIVVRMFNVVGAGQARQFALPSFARQLAAVRGEDGAVLKVGNLSPERDFVHIDDAVAAWITLIRHGAPGEVYNLGTGEAVSIRHALEHLMEVSGVGVPIEVDPKRCRPAEMQLSRADSSRLRALGWSPEKSLRDALEDLWREACEEMSSGA